MGVYRIESLSAIQTNGSWLGEFAKIIPPLRRYWASIPNEIGRSHAIRGVGSRAGTESGGANLRQTRIALTVCDE